jgi:hypothetical protein
MAATPTEIAIEKLKEFIKADPAIDQPTRDAVIADLEGAEPSKLAALKRKIQGEKTDAANSARGQQPPGPPR